MRALVFAGLVALVIFALILMPAISPAQQPAKVKTAPIVRSDPQSGKQMYTDYCAPCHGADAKGHGPAASAMKTPPANLTVLAKSNGGNYPAAHVSAILLFGEERSAHGSKDMPVWGQLFQSLNWSSSTKEVEAKQRINKVNEYLQSLQVK
jgi:mono/diheme cytochrome c family protein